MAFFLPAPTQLSQDQLESEERARAQRSHSTALVSSRREPPSLRLQEELGDFGDGVAFPEIHVAQFPLEMGRKKKRSNALAVQVDGEGKIARQGKDKVIFSKYSDLLPKEVPSDDAPELQKPDEEAVKELTEKTRDALMKQVSQKIAAAMPVRAADKQARHSASGTWRKIPPCISNWKNSYTTPLDKHLAADGRGLQTVHINENFAKLAEALYNADRKAREAVEMRAQVEKMAQKEKGKKEEKSSESWLRWRGEDGEARERDEIRHDGRKERQHDRNISRAAPDKRPSKLQRDQARDVSELIALGQPNPRASSETHYDQRLFNQTKGRQAYNIVWNGVHGMALKHILTLSFPSSRFVPDREFSGTDHGPRRDGPVQFEEDPFGLDTFLRRLSSTGAPRAPPPAEAPRTMTMTRNTGRSDWNKTETLGLMGREDSVQYA
uniref:SNW domain-containing protein 1 n=1 Tax=Salmo trutta TaxID=8032 RepID=A0A674APL5_SALTR